MSTNPWLGSEGSSDVAEHQLRKWELQVEAQRRKDEQATALPRKQLVYPCVTISRETGADGGEIARQVASQANWKVLDREILDQMAELYHWSRSALEYVDEQTASWFHESFGKLLDPHLVSQGEFVHRLGTILLMAAQHETTVFVGRGAQFLLPRPMNLSVRIIAPKKMRIQHISQRLQCNVQEAEKFIDETDKGRAKFVKQYFHVDVADPRLYDMVINLEFTSRDAAASMILSNYSARFGPIETPQPLNWAVQ